jgi:putative membrane protein
VEQAPGFSDVFSHFAFDPAWWLIIAAAGALYTVAWVRSRRLPCCGHPAWKLAVFLAGLVALAVAVVSPLEYYGNQVLWLNFLGFLVLTMMAAPLLLLGSPLTLAFRVAGPGRRVALRRAYRSWPVTVATHPVASWLGFAVFTYAWQFSWLTDEAASNVFVRDTQQVTLLLVSLCFWTPALCADPLRWRMAYPLRALYVFVEMTHKGLFGGMFLSMNHAFHPGFAAGLPAWAPDPIDDQRLGILILWIGGNIIFIAALIGIIIGWMAYERRNTHRTDWRLRLQREAEARRRAALEQVFHKTV